MKMFLLAATSIGSVTMALGASPSHVKDPTGEWISECHRTDDQLPYGTKSFRQVQSFQPLGRNIFKVIYFSDRLCEDPALYFSVNRSFSILPDAESSSIGKIDFGAALLDIVALDPKVVLNGPCTGEPKCHFVSDFDLIDIQADRVFFGLRTEAKDGMSNERRPTEIDTQQFLSRKT